MNGPSESSPVTVADNLAIVVFHGRNGFSFQLVVLSAPAAGKVGALLETTCIYFWRRCLYTFSSLVETELTFIF